MRTEGDHLGLSWRNGHVPVSQRFDDPYYSVENGLAETRHVYLKGNDLPARWAGASAFHIAELGFGTGLGFLAAWQLWRQLARPGSVLHFTSFELAPMPRADMARALAPWEDLAELSGALLSAWAGAGSVIELDRVRLQVIQGDARRAVPKWTGRADAWFLDGFAPSKNPEMWDAELLQAVHDRTAPGGTVATFSAAGRVRRRLADSGFRVEKTTGYGTKREMTIGQRPTEQRLSNPSPRAFE